MIIAVVNADNVPGMVTAAENLSCHIGTEVPHPVADILKCFRIPRADGLVVQQSTLDALIIRRLGVVLHRVDQILIDGLDPPVIRPGLIRLANAFIRGSLQHAAGGRTLICRNRRLDRVAGNQPCNCI